MAEIVAAFPDMQVAVADAGGLHLDQHLRSHRLRRRLIHLSQGRVEIGNLKALHRFSPLDGFLCWANHGALFWSIFVWLTGFHLAENAPCPAYLDQRMMASRELAGRDRPQVRHLSHALLIRARAAGAETAARRRRD